MNKELSEKNLEARKGRPTSPSPDITIFKPNDTFMICIIKSRGCVFGMQGSCTICDYGNGYNLTPDELRVALSQIRPELKGVNKVLFGSYGSVFCPTEVSKECFDTLLEFIAHEELKNVSFETHYSTVNRSILSKLRNKLPDTNIQIEMGYESCNEVVLNDCLNKPMNLSKLESTIQEIHQFGMSVILNVLVGVPLISPKEQLYTALYSVMWAFEHGADQVVLFPCTIKPYTYAYTLYEQGKYLPVPHWMMIELLGSIPAEYLDRVTLSKYLLADNLYTKGGLSSIPPTDCNICREPLQSFYNDYVSDCGTKRKSMISDLIGRECHFGCQCRSNFLKTIKRE